MLLSDYMTIFSGRERESSQPNPDLISTTGDKLKPEWVDSIEQDYGGFLRRVTFLPGINMIVQGADDDSLYVILRGNVIIIKQEADGTSLEQFRFGGRGAVVGEIRALNSTILRTRTVRADTEVEATRLYPQDLKKWNFGGKPWSDIHSFLRDLAEQRWRNLSAGDLKIGGVDFWANPVKGEESLLPLDNPPIRLGPLSRRIKQELP